MILAFALMGLVAAFMFVVWWDLARLIERQEREESDAPAEADEVRVPAGFVLLTEREVEFPLGVSRGWWSDDAVLRVLDQIDAL